MKLDPIIMLCVIVFCFFGFVIGLLTQIAFFDYPERDNACESLGYEEYTLKMSADGCVGRNGFTFVYMQCVGLFWNTKCIATPIDIGNIKVVG